MSSSSSSTIAQPASLQAPSIAMSGHGDAKQLCTPVQQQQLHSLAWFLSRTNHMSRPQSSQPMDVDRPANGTEGRKTHSQRHRKRLYHFLKSFAVILERNHESIAIYTGDTVGRNTYVATSLPLAVPSTLDHVVIGPEELQMASTKPTPEWAEGGVGSRVRLVEAKSTSSPVPLKYGPRREGYARWLMVHTVSTAGDSVFVTDVTFSQHISNVTEAVQEMHRNADSPKDTGEAMLNLGMYVYLNCAARCQETMSRGFAEYKFGELLSTSFDRRPLSPRDLRMPMCKRAVNESGERLPLPLEHCRLGPAQRQVLIQVLKDIASHLYVTDQPLWNLVRRPLFYDFEGRVVFQRLMRLLLDKAREAANRVVQYKRRLMKMKLRNGSIPEYSCDAETALEHNLRLMFHSYRLLNIIRDNFDTVIRAHALWLNLITASCPRALDMRYSPPKTPRPQGLDDEFRGLSQKLVGERFHHSCCEWLSLVCRPARGLDKLQPGSPKYIKNRSDSFHILRARTWHVYMSRPVVHEATPSLATIIQRLGFNFQQTDKVLTWLVEQGRITKNEARAWATLGGSSVSAFELIVLLLEMEKKRDTIELPAKAPDARYSPLLPDASITRRFGYRRIVAIGSKSPACRGSRRMLRWAMGNDDIECQAEYRVSLDRSWSPLDLPAWTRRDAANGIIRDAATDAAERIRRILEPDPRSASPVSEDEEE